MLGHASTNGVAGIGLLFVGGEPTLMLGPAPTGVVASVPWALLAAWLLLDRERMQSWLPG